MRVRYTLRAFSDLENIRSYIAQFGPQAAGRVIAVIEKLAARLSDFPDSGHPSPKLDARVLHSTRYPHRIYYRVRDNEIAILHIRHAARRPLRRSEL